MLQGTGDGRAAFPLPPMSSALHYVSDAEPGLRRQRAGRGILYRDSQGRVVKERATLDRIRALAIPPAYQRVWICADPLGHLQATGFDARGRKQYRYHPDWSEAQAQAKFEHMAAFARALPLIRAQVAQDLKAPPLSKTHMLATVAQLLDRTLIRVGNERYAAENRSYGLTTLRKRHIKLNGTQVILDFRAKSGQQRRVSLRDRRLAAVLRRCQELPGQRLFQYFDEAGEPQPLDSRDVNGYLQAIAGPAVSAKDYRTWAGTLLAAVHLRQLDPPPSKRQVAACMRQVAGLLGNTPAICRASYVHPAVVEAHMGGGLAELVALRGPPREGLSDVESALARFLETLEG